MLYYKKTVCLCVYLFRNVWSRVALWSSLWRKLGFPLNQNGFRRLKLQEIKSFKSESIDTNCCRLEGFHTAYRNITTRICQIKVETLHLIYNFMVLFNYNNKEWLSICMVYSPYQDDKNTWIRWVGKPVRLEETVWNGRTGLLHVVRAHRGYTIIWNIIIII